MSCWARSVKRWDVTHSDSSGAVLQTLARELRLDGEETEPVIMPEAVLIGFVMICCRHKLCVVLRLPVSQDDRELNPEWHMVARVPKTMPGTLYCG